MKILDTKEGIISFFPAAIVQIVPLSELIRKWVTNSSNINYEYRQTHEYMLKVQWVTVFRGFIHGVKWIAPFRGS